MALEMLSAAYGSKFVFEHIRGPMACSYEWSDMLRVGVKLGEFRSSLEALCRPVIDREYRELKEVAAT